MLAGEMTTIQTNMIRSNQFGVSVPGGAELLIHWRTQCNEHLQMEDNMVEDDPWAVIDIDVENCFPSIEWSSIEEAVKIYAQGLLAWHRWKHSKPNWVRLPCGKWHHVNRGADQGCPLGSFDSGATLALTRKRTLARLTKDNIPLADVWYTSKAAGVNVFTQRLPAINPRRINRKIFL
eukprot:Lithocolla_globosa_v1_NODE_5836_length_1177_cov_43.442068.p1 type:complete len:178 gc:universal NODE_5836_length_1177_cov_43.442068:774-241(-)